MGVLVMLTSHGCPLATPPRDPDRVVCSAFSQPRFTMNLKEQIELAVAQSFEQLGVTDSPPVVKQAQRREFGHYQVNGVMGAAKTAKMIHERLQTRSRTH